MREADCMVRAVMAAGGKDRTLLPQLIRLRNQQLENEEEFNPITEALNLEQLLRASGIERDVTTVPVSNWNQLTEHFRGDQGGVFVGIPPSLGERIPHIHYLENLPNPSNPSITDQTSYELWGRINDCFFDQNPVYCYIVE